MLKRIDGIRRKKAGRKDHDMKIVSWNCNCKFREKHRIISELDADIYVIQECENPQTTKSTEYRAFAENHLWIGNNGNKGLGIFARPSIHLRQYKWDTEGLSYFLPCKVDQSLDIVAVWAMEPYSKNYLEFQNRNSRRIRKKAVIIGDFNSNAIWDKKYSAGSHSKFVVELQKKGLISAYHLINGERHGEETIPTFYLYRSMERPYHMDYCFCKREILSQFTIGDYKYWLQYSDHMPLEVDISV